MKIAVFGMGKIGLPLAVQFARKGHDVIGVDKNVAVVAQVNSGVEPFPGEAHLTEYLADCVDTNRLRATTDAASAVCSADAVVVAVPLYVDAEARPDFTAIDGVAAVVGDSIQQGTLVSIETTLPVGTTRDRIGPEVARRSGLRVGMDFHLVFSPERVLTGRVFADLRRYPKLVGGVTPACEDAGVEFYESTLDFDERPDLPRPNGVWRMGTAEAAEMAKLAETTYRDVNIALANQFALYAERRGLDVYSVIEACNSQPYSHIHTPGVAVGGHCIPVYPRLYLWGDDQASVVRVARDANAAMPQVVAQRLDQVTAGVSGKHVVILGAAYRGGVKETAFSGVFPLQDALVALGARVSVHDPIFSSEELQVEGLTAYVNGESVDAAVVQADHAEYRNWGPSMLPGVQVIIDGRNVLQEEDWPGVQVLHIGRPTDG